jgi:hypothetical protein
VTGSLALIGAICALLLLIRGRDFVSRAQPRAATATDAPDDAGKVSGVRSA